MEGLANPDQHGPLEVAPVTYWRERVLDQVLLGTLVLGAIVYGPSVYMAVASSTLGVAFIDTVAFAGVIGLYFAKRLPHHVRAAVFLLIIYFLSTWLLVSVGPISQVYLLGFAIFAGLLIGFRAAIGALAISGATLLGVGYHMQANFPSRFLDEFGSLPAWSVITLNFVLVNSVICISIAILLRGLEASIGKEHASAAALQEEHNRLSAAFTQLERESNERDRAQREFRRLALAVDQSTDSVILLNEIGRVEYVNAACLQLTGLSESEVIGCSFVRLINAVSQENDLFVDETRDGARRRIAVRSGGDAPRSIIADITEIRENEDQLTGFAIIMRDLSHEAEMERRQRRSQKLEAVGTLAGGIAHDFNNMLTAILGYAQLIRTREPESGFAANAAGEIERASLRASGLIRQILTFSRQVESDSVPVRVEDVVHEALQLLRPSIPSTIEIRTRLNRNTGLVWADPTQLHQIVVNLCTNAYQSMETGSGTLTISTDVTEVDEDLVAKHPLLESGTQYVRLSIGDTGCGMDRQTQERMFDPFFTTKDRLQGTGLGLSIVHGIVTSLKGDVTVYSEVGRGTTMCIYLPKLSGKVPSDARTTPATMPRGNGQRLLVVDDEPSLVALIEKMLKQLGYACDAFNDSEDAFEAFLADPARYDAVLSDLTMPKRTGPELAVLLRRHKPDIPIVLMSGFGDSGKDKDTLSRESAAYLQKPFAVADLAAALHCVFNGTGVSAAPAAR